MKRMTKKCPVCGNEYSYMDIRNVPKTCGARICVTNLRYREKTFNPMTGEYQSFKKIGKL